MIAGGKCFYKVEEWWQYEVCYNKHVKQYHMEGTTLVDEYSLGSWNDSATDLDAIKVRVTSVQQHQA